MREKFEEYSDKEITAEIASTRIAFKLALKDSFDKYQAAIRKLDAVRATPQQFTVQSFRATGSFINCHET